VRDVRTDLVDREALESDVEQRDDGLGGADCLLAGDPLGGRPRLVPVLIACEDDARYGVSL
jgi:hypothetical protein